MSFSSAARDYLLEHGIAEDAAVACGVREESGYVLYPYVTDDDERYNRRRPIGGGNVRTPAGAKAAAWWPQGPPERAERVLVAEGESDALAAVTAQRAASDPHERTLLDGLVVVAVPGAGFPPDRLRDALARRECTEAILAFDGDDAGRRGAHRTAATLRAAGITVLQIDPEDGHDLADCIAAAEHPAAWLANQVADAQAFAEENRADSSPADTFPLLSFDDLLALPEPSWLIDGLVPASGLSVLYGRPGAAKTFLALDWALSVATGKPWLGHEVERRWVIYVAAEGKAGLRARAEAWHVAHGNPDMSRVRWLADAVNLRDRAQVDRARRTLAALPERPGLIVVDTMARSMVGGDENAAKDVGEFIAAVDVLRESDAAIVVHHSGHDGERERGSSALRGAADLLAKVDRDGKSPSLTLTCDKSKDAPEFDALSLRLEPAGDSLVLSLVIEAKPQDDLRKLVLSVVAEHEPVSGREVVKKIRKRDEDVRKALRELQREGEISEEKDGWRVRPEPPDAPGRTSAGAQGGRASQEGCTPPEGAPLEDAPRAESAEACPDELSAEDQIVRRFIEEFDAVELPVEAA
jgi:KaiC/GvpD/RAD55 family RecA-like ATPase